MQGCVIAYPKPLHCPSLTRSRMWYRYNTAARSIDSLLDALPDVLRLSANISLGVTGVADLTRTLQEGSQSIGDFLTAVTDMQGIAKLSLPTNVAAIMMGDAAAAVVAANTVVMELSNAASQGDLAKAVVMKTKCVYDSPPPPPPRFPVRPAAHFLRHVAV
jgi:hypothetical protein